MAFSALHVFPYSRRPGTPAAEMEGQVLNSEKKRRAGVAGQLARRLQGQYLQALVGQRLEVLFEEEKNGIWQGHAPNYVLVRASGQAPPDLSLHNRVLPVAITAAQGDHLVGRIVE